jgi:NAD(P)-dependent dehydrogenase (short-subunit alcohol dehydrogenase family)
MSSCTRFQTRLQTELLFTCWVFPETQLAPAYVYLASDEASYTSGTTLGVAGGMPLN